MVTSLHYSVLGATNLLSCKMVNQMFLHSESKQIYFGSVYDEYMHNPSEFKYLLDLINQNDWPSIPEFDNHRINEMIY
jgi:hypothetical protein